MSLFLKHTYKERPSKDHSNWLKQAANICKRQGLCNLRVNTVCLQDCRPQRSSSKWTQSDFSNIGQWETGLTVAPVLLFQSRCHVTALGWCNFRGIYHRLSCLKP